MFVKQMKKCLGIKDDIINVMLKDNQHKQVRHKHTIGLLDTNVSFKSNKLSH